MAASRAWASRFLSNPADLPIRFSLAGTDITGIPAHWKPVTRTRPIDSNMVEIVFEGVDPDSGLNVRVECLQYRDYPVVEWVAWFTNTGEVDSPTVSDIMAMDVHFDGSSPKLHHCNGDFCSEEGYTPQETPISRGESLDFAPNGGRPCDGAFPYYRIEFDGCGITMAIGWPGQWAAKFDGVDDGVRVRVGQQRTNIALKPGETVRSPKMTLLFWTGDTSIAVNFWRRWYSAHVLPRPDGAPLKPLLACEAPDDGVEFTAATEENQLRHLETAAERGIPFDVWWIDAGWYSCYDENGERQWPLTGTWEPDAERFPTGLKRVSDSVAQHGADLLIWFEPERVNPGTELNLEHPEWLLDREGTSNRLLNLGIPQCRQWLTDHVCALIKDNGIKIYRQDHNFEPLEHWRENEVDDRQGVNENLHVQGYLQYWDELLLRNPGLWIDSCASGGRRNDLETLRRSVPLHYTDYGYGDHPVKLAFHRTMYEWIPYFKESAVSWDIGGHTRFAHEVDSFSFHCGFAPMLSTGLDIERDDYDYGLAQKMIEIWRRASELLLYGDYYPHTPFHRDPKRWVAWQFDSPESGLGFIQGIRLPQSPEKSISLFPKNVSEGAVYTFENLETKETQEISGEELTSHGFTIALEKRSGAIWFYSKQPE